MKRDAWYAAIAALGLCAAGAAYALIAAPKLADPTVRLSRSSLTASLPSPPARSIDRETLATAQEILSRRDPFSEGTSLQVSASRGLDLPKLGRPVQFSAPNEVPLIAEPAQSLPRTTATQPNLATPTRAGSPATPTPQTARGPSQPQGSLTLRGVYPSATGGYALVAMPDGSMVSVGVGGMVGGWRVLQIQQGAIRLGRGQRAILLAMPR